MPPPLLLVGLGDLGSILLELLLREGTARPVIVASREAGQAEARCNLARLSALSAGREPDVSFVPLDLFDEVGVAEVVRRVRPDIVVSTASMLTWWLPDLLPSEAAEQLRRAPFGSWLPVHLGPTLKLMRALHAAEFRGLTVTAPFPDVVNCALGRIGLAPTCGVGNLDEIVPKVRWLAAERLGVSAHALDVFLVAHHALERSVLWDVSDRYPPYFLRVELDGVDVTADIGAHDLLRRPIPVAGGRAIHFLTASSAVRLIGALDADVPERLHAPGPAGLPGGYPVHAGRNGVSVATVPGLSLEDAIAINEQSHPFDGIERIEADGTVVFTESGASGLRETLGYSCERLPISDAEDRAEELVARFSEYAARWGVDLARGR